MNKEILNIAFLQQDIIWENPSANYALIEIAFAKSFGSESHVDIIVVPETFSTGFSDNMASLAESSQGPTYTFACQMARRYDALFVGTWTVRENGAVYNRLHCVRPDGTFNYYDKAHTFRMSSEATQLARGLRHETFEWRGWRLRPAVCYDLRFPLWLRNCNLGVSTEDMSPNPNLLQPQLDYDVLLVCANWPASRFQAWDTLLKARAIENQCYAIGVNRVGVDETGIPYSGNSAVIDFRGLPLAEAQPDEQEVVMASIDKEALIHFRQHWPFWLDADCCD